MGNKTSQLKPADLATLRNDTAFSDAEIREFHKDFMKAYPKGVITKMDLIKIYKKHFPEGDATNIADEIFRMYDFKGDGKIDFREFLIGLGALTNGTEEQKLMLAFEMYDTDGTGYLNKEEVRRLVDALHMAKSGSHYDKAAAHVAGSVLFEEMDRNNDNRIGRAEFIRAAERDPSIIRLLKIDLTNTKCCS